MEIEQLVGYLDDVSAAESWLETLGVSDAARAHRNLNEIADSGMPLDLVCTLCESLQAELPHSSDSDMALNNLERFVRASRSPLSLGTLFKRDPHSLRTVLQIGSTSQYLSDLLIRDPEGLDLLQLTSGQPVARQVLVDEICAEADSIEDERLMRELLRRYKHRETLRIAYGDIVMRQPVEVVARQISYLADAIIVAAVRFARRIRAARKGDAYRPDGQPARFAVLSLGKLGGEELNYSSDIDLVFICDPVSQVGSHRNVDSTEFFVKLAKLVIQLLGESTESGIAYRVDMRLRPHGASGPLVLTKDAALRYYDVSGRTWERQAFVKARHSGGSAELGASFLRQLEPWVFRRYLASADISGIKALKRNIERRAAESGLQNIKTGHGGIRDIEFVIQFLQLLNAGDTPSLRTGNTLEAIHELEQKGCLNHQERTILVESYSMLRKVEHRLQVMFDMQTHTLPSSKAELRKLAIRMDYSDIPDGTTALEQFTHDLDRLRSDNRRILDHLLHDAFADEDEADPLTDLVLDPTPTAAMVERLLAPYGFRDIQAAHQRLLELAEERIPFLSSLRCRHFLASIAPKLLDQVGRTPDPDGALLHLSQVSDSLGGKGVLWELFSFSPATLQLYVRLCATSDYLSTMLKSQPGMIDELMDSLVLAHLFPKVSLERQLAELCLGAESLDPILMSFKNLQHLRIGVREILGKSDLDVSHGALADVAEVVLRQVVDHETKRLTEKHGTPTLANGTRAADFIIVALGKLGGREPNYHSDLDLVYLYEGGGQTEVHSRSQKQTTNQHFFSLLGQRIIKRMTQQGVTGKLYELDSRLRPNGASGMLAVSLDALMRYFETSGALWERLALCKARVVYGSEASEQRTLHAIRVSQFSKRWSVFDANEIATMRKATEKSAADRNLKRGVGGTMDVEFIVQRMQLEHGKHVPECMAPNTLDAIDRLGDEGILNGHDAELLRTNYTFLRTVESRLRLLNTVKRHDLPADPLELEKLAFLLELPDAATLQTRCEETRAEIRAAFRRLVG